MPEEPRFKRSLVVIALLHVLLVAGFFVAGRWEKKSVKKEIVVWIDGSIGGGDASGDADIRPVNIETTPPPEAPELFQPPKIEPEPEPLPPPVESKPPSEIATATPPPTTPKPATPKPATPKPTTPKPATPKPATPKATPATTPKPKASPKPTAVEDSDAPKPKATPSDKPKGTPTAAKTGGAGTATTKLASAKAGGNGPGTGNGKGLAKSGNGEGTSEFGWYLGMIQDRFKSRWAQPMTIERNGAEIAVTLKVRINNDGTISHREIVQPSGYPQMDESVMAAAAKVLQIDPLPAGLGDGASYEVNVQFKLDQAQ